MRARAYIRAHTYHSFSNKITKQLRELKAEAEKEARDTREELRRQRALWRQQVCFVFNLFNFRCHRKAKSHRGRRGLGFRVSVFSFLILFFGVIEK